MNTSLPQVTNFYLVYKANFNNEQGEIESFSKELTRNVFNQKQGYMLLF